MPLIYNPHIQAVDTNGDVFAGAKMTVLDAGTSDLRQTFSDKALTVPNANPLIADGAGIFGPFYLAASETDYKLQFDTAANVNIPSLNQDNIPVSSLDQATIGLILYPETAAETSAGVTPTDFTFPEGNVRRYGAVGDATGIVGSGTDDSDAIIDALNVATSSGTFDSSSVYFPRGKYRITKTVFSAFTATEQVGLHIYGEGMWGSMIVIDAPSAADIWAFDNGTNKKIQHYDSVDLGFMGAITGNTPTTAVFADVSQYNNIFKITAATGTLHEKGFNFTRCNFLTCAQAFAFAGDDIASEIKFVQCRFNRIRNSMYTLDNQASFNHDFITCDVEQIWGDVFEITGGGGNVRVYGGSWIMAADDQDTPVDRFLVKFASGSAFNFTAAPFVFNGFALELRGNKSKLYQCVDVLSTMTIFRDCRFFNNSSEIKNIVEMTRQNYIKFADCNFVRPNIDQFWETFTITSLLGGGSAGELVFDGTTWPEPITAGVVQKMLSDVIIFDSTHGIARGRNNFGRTTNVFTADPLLIAQDFDLSAVTATDAVMSGTSPHRPLKTAVMMNDTSFPNAGGTARERTIKLPVGAMIKNIYIEKDASGANTDAYQLHVGTDDKVTTHGSSTNAQIKDLHTIELEKQFIDVGTADNDRVIRMWATGTTNTDVVVGGHAFIEYY